MHRRTQRYPFLYELLQKAHKEEDHGQASIARIIQKIKLCYISDKLNLYNLETHSYRY